MRDFMTTIANPHGPAAMHAAWILGLAWVVAAAAWTLLAA